MTISTDYKILSFDPTKGQIKVKFDLIPHNIPLDLHLNQMGLYPEGDELDKYIRGIFPKSHLQRIEAINNGVPNADAIAALVQKLPESTSTASNITSIAEPNEIDVNEIENIRMIVSIQKTLALMAGATV